MSALNFSRFLYIGNESISPDLSHVYLSFQPKQRFRLFTGRMNTADIGTMRHRGRDHGPVTSPMLVCLKKETNIHDLDPAK